MVVTLVSHHVFLPTCPERGTVQRVCAQRSAAPWWRGEVLHHANASLKRRPTRHNATNTPQRGAR